MPQAFVGQAFGAGCEIERLERNPARVPATLKHFKDRLKIVAARAAVAAVQFVDVHVADEIEVAVHQRGVRFLFIDGLAAVAPRVESQGVKLLVEALPIAQSDVVQTLAEAVAIVGEIASPAIGTMFDVHNAIDEEESHAALVDRYFDFIHHVHVNELDGRHCGAGSYDFKPVLEVLQRRGYTGWVSLEAFDFTPGAERLANESLRHLENQIGQLQS